MGAPFIKMDLRWCALLVFLFGFVMATYFVVRLTSSNSAQLNTQLQLVTYSNHSNSKWLTTDWLAQGGLSTHTYIIYIF